METYLLKIRRASAALKSKFIIFHMNRPGESPRASRSGVPKIRTVIIAESPQSPHPFSFGRQCFRPLRLFVAFQPDDRECLNCIEKIFMMGFDS
jgi:hypothetical protein